MKKKVLSLILAGTMTLGLALTGCGGSDGGGSGSGRVKGTSGYREDGKRDHEPDRSDGRRQPSGIGVY